MYRGRALAALFALLAIGGRAAHAETTAIVGGTLIDVSDYGRSSNDIAKAVILLEAGKIIAVGPMSRIVIPRNARRIDARGRFLIPGLIDGFGALRRQSFAGAYLYDGVTTVYVPTVLPGGGGDGETRVVRGPVFGPRVFLGAPVTGYSQAGADPSGGSMSYLRLHGLRLSRRQLIARVDRLAAYGYRGVTISYDVWPDQVDTVVREAKRLGLATLGEPAFTRYPQEIRSGVDALVHDDHYLVDVAPAVAQLARANDLASGVAAYRAICTAGRRSAEITAFGEQLAASHTALMPTLSIEATADALDVPNPWSAGSAALISAADLDSPVNRKTGASGWLAGMSAERIRRVTACAWHKERLDARLYQLGAKFLAGSGAPAYGVMPGSGLHLELTLLHRIGLTPREAIAAATGNYAEVYGWPDVGRIEPGRVADILMLNADPRSDVSAADHIDKVIFRGRIVDRRRLLNTAIGQIQPLRKDRP